MKSKLVVARIGTLVLAFAVLAAAAQNGRFAASVPDISGVWVQDVQPALHPGWADLQGKPFQSLPFTTWGAQQFKSNRATHGANMVPSMNSTEPIAKCLPPGVPAIYMFIFPMEIMQIPGRVVMLFEYGNYVRQIFTDGRKHQNLTPLWMGDSIAHWEGDTLAVDADGFNDKTWIDNEGDPHSDQLHVVERIRRTDRTHLVDEITVDDPKTYSEKMVSKRNFDLQPTWNIAEFVCEDNQGFLDYEKKAGTDKK